MVYGFARQSHGHVRIYSEIGKGTMVCLYLPRHDQEEDSGEMRTSHELEHDAGEAKILVVDDEPTIRMLITESLSEPGSRPPGGS
jgi:PleD family two-component response regulator